jgi:hypothetical protein
MSRLKKYGMVVIIIFIPGFLIWAMQVSSQAIIAGHHAVSQFDSIPIPLIQQIGDEFRFYYGHTSHGSQIMTGLYMLEAQDSVYRPAYFFEWSDDLGSDGDTSWAPHLRYALSNNGYNMCMMSWCGGCSDNTEEGIDIYLSKFGELEQEFPEVTFIYMTGHLDGTGPDGNLYRSNDQIREYCLANGKVLFDFADIESYDPDGTYYPSETDTCGWCHDWCGSHVCPDCIECAHSHCFNCYLKGKAFWWMMARISGWNPGGGDCGDLDGSGVADMLDVIYLIAYLYRQGPAPDPLEMGDINRDGAMNMIDVIYLVSYLYKGGPGPVCP